MTCKSTGEDMNTNNISSRRQEIERLASLFGAGDLAGAERIAQRLFIADRKDEEALHLLAQIIFRQGRAMESVTLMQELFGLNPMQAAYHNDFGVMLACLGRWADAEAAHRMALALDPSSVDARYNLALALFRQKKNEAALEILSLLAQDKPDFAEQYALCGEVLQSENRHAEAVVAYAKAVELGLQSPEVMGRLGTALSDAGNKDEAFALLAKSGTLDSEDPATNFYLGNLFREQGKLEDAAGYYRKAIASSPRFAEAHNNLGLVLQGLGDTRGAEEEFAKGISASPELSALHNNMGNSQLQHGRMDIALACFRKAAELAPESFEAWNNLGETCYRLQRLDEAEECYRKALALNPECVGAELNLGILLLLRGNFSEGWRHYEKRWDMPHIRERRPRFAQPEWQGEPLDGKTLLIYVEQGMGDNIQFVRYLRILRDRYPGALIYYWGLKPLMRLFADLATSCGVELLPETIPGGVPPIDYHIALLTVPERLGTTLDTIPAAVPYLAPPAGLTETWARRLAGLQGKKVGLVWASGETYQFHMFRTMQLAQLKPLLDVPGIAWVSLQKGNGAGQIAEEGLSGKIVNLMDEVEDFADTAAIIANLDLVISVDTSVPHLAGALGKPVWLLDRFDTDWRWLLGRTDCPWYPTMRIFRQTSFGDWGSVVVPAARALADWVDASSAPAVEDASGPVALKLNLGCGNRKMAGFVNVDFVEVCQPDLVVNLEQTPWPWQDNSVEEIKLIHVLEHLGQQTDVFLSIVKEMYRVCRDGARIEIIVPHPRSDAFLGDPTHVRPVTGDMLNLFNQRLNREWEKVGAANTPLGIILDVDFEIESMVHTLEPDWQRKLSSGQISEAEVSQAARQFNNVISQSTIIWRVRKAG